MRVRAWSTTISVCTQTSPSGCHSGSCGQPTSACSSGNSRSMTPRSSASARPIDGRAAWSSSFSISPQMRSARQVVERNRAAERARAVVERRARIARRTAARAARAGCRRRTSRDRRRAGRGAARSPRPLNGSRYLAGQRIPGDRVDGEIAPPRGLFERQVGIAGDGEALWPRPVFDSRRGQRHVDARRPCRP